MKSKIFLRFRKGVSLSKKFLASDVFFDKLSETLGPAKPFRLYDTNWQLGYCYFYFHKNFETIPLMEQIKILIKIRNSAIQTTREILPRFAPVFSKIVLSIFDERVEVLWERKRK